METYELEAKAYARLVEVFRAHCQTAVREAYLRAMADSEEKFKELEAARESLDTHLREHGC